MKKLVALALSTLLGVSAGACGGDDASSANAGGTSSGGADASAAASGGMPSGGSGGLAGAAATGGVGASGGSAGSTFGGAGGAGGSDAGAATCAVLGAGPHESERVITGFADRAYDLHVPPSYDCHKPAAVVVALHGGGTNKEHAQRASCPGDDPASMPSNPNAPGCLNAVADAKGFVVVYPNGTKNPLFPNQNVRTFNAGGGKNGYTCVSQYACSNNVNEGAYFSALLDDLKTIINVDPKRIFATGASNGAAMAHKLACAASQVVAAIAPVAGGNQYAAVEACTPTRPVPVLEVHGTQDPCWPYLGGNAGCAALGKMVGIPAGVALTTGPSTIDGWVARNKCATTPTTVSLPDPDPADGTVRILTYSACEQGADVKLVEVENGGHHWPGGWTYSTASGIKTDDINASEVILDFFAAHPMP